MVLKTLTAIPVYNEIATVGETIAQALYYGGEVLVVDDGSTDGTSDLLRTYDQIHLIVHPKNFGYGKALRSAFEFAIRGGYDILTTIDCDGQHQPHFIPQFVQTCLKNDADIVSGSRYLQKFPADGAPPEDRRRINEIITSEINHRFGLNLTDAFCGFKTYRVSALAKLQLTENGYAMPLELWVQAATLGLRIIELPVPLIYLDHRRSFGGPLDDAETRLIIYKQVLDKAAKTTNSLTVNKL